MDLECPYCGKGLNICHDDGFGYDEGVAHEMECRHCEKTFVFYTSVSYSYDPYKADCLNDGKHNWKLTDTWPEEFSEMECTMCLARRDLTEEERLEHNLGTKEDYFKKLEIPKKLIR